MKQVIGGQEEKGQR